jgi:hypothetical protein
LSSNFDEIKRFTMVRYSTVTHSVNTDQVLVDLDFVSKSEDSITIRIPWNSAMAPPGHWMLFALDKYNVPSVGKTFLLSLPISGPINAGDPSILPIPQPIVQPTPLPNEASQSKWYSIFLGILALL